MRPTTLNSFDDLLAAAPRPDSSDSGGSECVVRLQKRIDHLLAEIDALKTSHADAVAAAVQEREQRLQEQEEHLQHLRAVMMSAADGIVTADAEGRIEWFNDRAGAIFGYLPSEVVGQPLSLLQPPNWRPERPSLSECAVGRLRSGGANMIEVEGRRKDGTVFPLEISASRIDIGDRCCHAIICRDISERKAMEAQLRQAQKLESIGQLAAGIAHEINTPTQYIGDNIRFLDDAFRDLVQVISHCLQISRFQPGERSAEELLATIRAATESIEADFLCEEIPKAIEQALDGVERVAAIVRSMKEFSHLGSGERQALDVNRALQATVTVSRNEWKYVAEIDMQLAPDLPTILGYPSDCNQVFLNLIVNAAHAIGDKVRDRSGEKGRISIATVRDGPWVVVTIRDTGTGIPPEIRERVFDPFFTTKPVGRGTGQGLAIARSIIVDKHRGQISFESEVGQGTTFVIRLPIQPVEGTPADGR